MNKTDLMAPRPVHPRALCHHGLFGETFVKQHMVIDDRWSTGAIIDEFQGIANLLSKRLIFKHLENKASRKLLAKSARDLRTQCHDGRTKLHRILGGQNVLSIRNYLINHKDLQRLYQKMPISLVVENINQRTFVMRKERDRLRDRLKKLKKEYKLIQVQRGSIENRIKYQNEFVLEEEIKTKEYVKKIQNSKVRLSAIKTINATYQKVLEILSNDEIFYEPIMRSLSQDIEDQQRFIKHILYLGIPAIGRLKKLSEEHRLLQDKTRKNARRSTGLMSIKTGLKIGARSPKAPERVLNMGKHYTRETKSMLKLKNQLEAIEIVIKQIKMATLCSRAREIFPRFKTQMENNLKLVKDDTIGTINNEFSTFKEKVARELESVLVHNYSEEEEKRLAKIKELKEQLKLEDEIEQKTLDHMKSRGAVYVILRYFLWNLSDILKHVGATHRIISSKYPNTYLKLPLLKFEMLTMRAVVPERFEEDTKALLDIVKKKLRILMEDFRFLFGRSRSESGPQQSLEELLEEYHNAFMARKEEEEELEEDMGKPVVVDDPYDHRVSQNVPNRKQIKLQSARIVEELSKKEEE